MVHCAIVGGAPSGCLFMDFSSLVVVWDPLLVLYPHHPIMLCYQGHIGLCLSPPPGVVVPRVVLMIVASMVLPDDEEDPQHGSSTWSSIKT
eukprot:scaffold103439_cov94-Attheya_sp.AAC.2